MSTLIRVNENLILHYEDGKLCIIEKQLDKTAITIGYDGSKRRYKNGFLHRNNGPAIIYKNGTKRWCFNGNCFCTEEDFIKFKNR